MRKKRPYFVFAAFSLPIFFVLQNTQNIQAIHAASLSVVRPVVLGGHSLVRFFSEARDKNTLFWQTFHQNEQAQENILKLRNQLFHVEELSKENLRLKKILEFKDALSQKSVGARIIGWDPSLLHKMVLLDKGTSQGIKKNMTVLVAEGLVGRVLEAGPSISRVILVTDPESRVSSVTSGSRSQGVLAGDGSLKLKLIYLDLDSGVQVGEEVLTSGVGQLFPKGLSIGKISSIKRNSEGLHLEATVEPYVRFSKLEEVLCLGSSRRK